MNPKTILTLAFFTFIMSSPRAQPDCSTDFYTINIYGLIQQWSLSNQTISGGDTILSGGGVSLSYCGNSDNPTFFSNNANAPYTGFTYYNPDSGWVNVSNTFLQVDNNGGHGNDQYYMIEGGVIQIIKYWDGANLSTVDSLHLHGEFFAGVQDIAVDTSGQAWIFTGSLPSVVDSLKVFNQNGKVNSYTIQFNKIAYGSFFLNDTLYLGTYTDSIFPVLINGGTAQLGNPIPFISNSFTDMASCQKTGSPTSVFEFSRGSFKVFPNPIDDEFYIDLGNNYRAVSITITDLNGRIIQSHKYFDCQLLNLSIEEPPGVYLLTIETGDKKTVIKLLKE